MRHLRVLFECGQPTATRCYSPLAGEDVKCSVVDPLVCSKCVERERERMRENVSRRKPRIAHARTWIVWRQQVRLNIAYATVSSLRSRSLSDSLLVLSTFFSLLFSFSSFSPRSLPLSLFLFPLPSHFFSVFSFFTC